MRQRTRQITYPGDSTINITIHQVYRMPKTPDSSYAKVISNINTYFCKKKYYIDYIDSFDFFHGSIETKSKKIIELDFTLFNELGIRAPHLKVLSCKQSDNKEWILHLGFVGASEAVLQKLRAWIYKQSTQNKAVA